MDNAPIIIFLVAVVFVMGIMLGIAIDSPNTKDVVKLDGRSCILVYEQDVIRKFCEAE